MLSIAKLQNLKAIHNKSLCHIVFLMVVINRKTTKFESNSQQFFESLLSRYSCYQSQNYKIWKQFTTALMSKKIIYELLSIAKLQNLKAIHNESRAKRSERIVVINRKTTKFESNSQQQRTLSKISSSCYQSQNYKIWKQFTTISEVSRPKNELLSIAKLQNLKAIHNPSQYVNVLALVVINRKTTKFESNSQLRVYTLPPLWGCYQSQNYKIWKQFTTAMYTYMSTRELLSIAKLQNLKAIHNRPSTRDRSRLVVINRKTTKFESNSQHRLRYIFGKASCYQSQNYKIWKQFTTPVVIIGFHKVLLSIAKLQNLKAIHNYARHW